MLSNIGGVAEKDGVRFDTLSVAMPFHRKSGLTFGRRGGSATPPGLLDRGRDGHQQSRRLVALVDAACQPLNHSGQHPATETRICPVLTSTAAADGQHEVRAVLVKPDDYRPDATGVSITVGVDQPFGEDQPDVDGTVGRQLGSHCSQ